MLDLKITDFSALMSKVLRTTGGNTLFNHFPSFFFFLLYCYLML